MRRVRTTFVVVEIQ